MKTDATKNRVVATIRYELYRVKVVRWRPKLIPSSCTSSKQRTHPEVLVCNPMPQTSEQAASAAHGDPRNTLAVQQQFTFVPSAPTAVELPCRARGLYPPPSRRIPLTEKGVSRREMMLCKISLRQYMRNWLRNPMHALSMAFHRQNNLFCEKG